jgi:hypothetical protein
MCCADRAKLVALDHLQRSLCACALNRVPHSRGRMLEPRIGQAALALQRPPLVLKVRQQTGCSLRSRCALLLLRRPLCCAIHPLQEPLPRYPAPHAAPRLLTTHPSNHHHTRQ